MGSWANEDAAVSSRCPIMLTSGGRACSWFPYYFTKSMSRPPPPPKAETLHLQPQNCHGTRRDGVVFGECQGSTVYVPALYEKRSKWGNDRLLPRLAL